MFAAGFQPPSARRLQAARAMGAVSSLYGLEELQQ
jgi:hypothetical protein